MHLKPDVPTSAAALAALLVSVDGVIDPRERDVAISLGHRMFYDFSGVKFDTLLAGVETLPSPSDLGAILADLLDADGKVLVMEYLVALAVADDRVVDVERDQLAEVARSLGTAMPSFGPYPVEETEPRP